MPRVDAQRNISPDVERMRARRLFFLTDLQYKSGNETFHCAVNLHSFLSQFSA